MQKLTRLALMLAVMVLALFCGAMFIAAFAANPTFGWLSLAIGGGLFALNCRYSKQPNSGLFGTARFATFADMSKAGLVGAPRGVLIGTVVPPRPVLAALKLFTAPWRETESALQTFFASLRKKPLPVRVDGTHVHVCASTGAGKGTAVLIPHLLTDTGNVIVMDPKGENAKATMRARREMGQKVVLLDFFGLTGKKSDGLNPLDGIDANGKSFLDNVKALSDALVVRNLEEKEPHFNDYAVVVLTAIITYVVKHEPSEKNLQFVADIAANDEALSKVQMVLKADADPLIQRLGGALGNLKDRERASVMTTVFRHLSFLNSHNLIEGLSKTTFRLASIREGMSIYIVVPLEYMASHAGLLRLLVVSLMRAVQRGGLDESNPVTFLIDEAPALGKLDAVKTALTQLRGFGLRLMLFTQNVQQLEEMFPGQSQTALGAFDTSIYFGVNDYPTAELCSKLVGQGSYTKIDTSGGTSKSRNYDPQGQVGTSYSSNEGWSRSEHGRSVIMPEEVLGLPKQTAVVFSKRCRPILSSLVPYFSKDFRELGKPARKLWNLAQAVALLAVSLLPPFGILLAADAKAKRQAPPPLGVYQSAGPEKRDDDRLRDGAGR